MKKLKLIVSTILLFLIMGIALAQTNIVFAANTQTQASVEKEPIYFALSKTFSDNPGNIGYTNLHNMKIYDVRAYSSKDATNEMLVGTYCLKAGFGSTWNSTEIPFYNTELDESSKIKYDKYANLDDIEEVSTKFPNINIVKQLVDKDKYYNEILWLLDNMYIPKVSSETEKLSLFNTAGIGNGKINSDGEIFNEELTDSDIEAVNQLALWYYTNFKMDGNSSYDSLGQNDNIDIFLNYAELKEDGTLNTVYTELRDLSWSRDAQARKLLKFYATEAEKVHSEYNTGKPVQISDNEVESIVTSGKTKIGPITITKNSNLPYSIECNVKNQSGYTITDETGKAITLKNNVITSDSLEELWKDDNTIDLYITLNSKVTSKIDINMSASYKAKTLWLTSTSLNDATSEQPIVVVEKVTDKLELSSEPKTFDLKLIKYISQVNSQNLSLEDKRTENSEVDGIITIDSSKLKDKTATTAEYTVSKNPVLVDYGDLITYTIRVYNEGDISGYASEISENIPAGLEFVANNEINRQYGWTLGEDGIARTTYLTKSDDQDNLLLKYDRESDNGEGSGLSYKYVQIVLKVSNIADYKNIIRNEAAISQDMDEKGNPIDDRDSEPENWIGKDDHNKYQDDEDYDNVRLKVLDLALRKYITKVNKVTVPTREPNINTSNLYKLDSNGNYIDTTADYKHKKDPVEVEDGDLVVYNITVYNEGNKAGFAKKIIDQLPTGLLYSGTAETTTATRTSGTGNTYKISYNKETNQITLEATTQNALVAYDGTLDSETIEITCKVNQRPDVKDKIYLTNIAWINLAYDSEKNVNIPGNELGIHDTDSEPENYPNNSANDLNTKNDVGYIGNDSNKNDLTDSNYFYEGKQDDDDFEKLVLKPKVFDLALRKFIIKVENKSYSKLDESGNTIYTRAPQVDTTNLYKELNGNLVTTATYNHTKKPVYAQVGNKVIYVIRVYNEGEVDGYVGKITDYLPENLEFVKDSEINKKYGWVYDEETRKVTTIYLAKSDAQDNLLAAFNTEKDKGNGEGLSYKDVQIECIIKDTAEVGKYLTNIAEISEYQYKDGTVINPDIDSTSDNLDYPEDVPSYKQDEIGKDYVPGQQDDDDFEKIIVSEFDLALRKYITKVGTQEVNNRVPEITYENGKIVYKHTKEPVLVTKGDVVIYTLAIYNEGTLDGYASEITDYILKNQGLAYLNGHDINKEYGWKMYDAEGKETEDAEKAVTIKTDYLSKEKEKEPGENLLKAFNKDQEISDTNPDRKILKIAYMVEDTTKSKDVLVNISEISADTDKDGDEIDDIDSTPGSDKKNYPDNGYNTEDHEDDIDYDPVIVTEFDLALKKYVTQAIVIENGKETIQETGHTGDENPEPVVKVELGRKDLSKVKVKFRYTIKITNEGDIEGYAKEITDYIPAGLKFVAEDNPGWTDEGNNVISTRLLENTLLKPGESAKVTVLLTWINGKDNLGLKTNIAEISEDYNDKDVPDRDSTPDNKVPGEDDIDDAPVILAVKTGNEPTYYFLAFVVLITIAGGILLIKRFVL